ncbi:MAG: GNAT family N-acetyltransferase [Sphingomicrobium sp.]
MIREAPRIETDRLILRPWRREDFRPYHAILRQPAVYRHFGTEPMGQEECWRRMVASSGMWGMVGFGGWAAERKSDGTLVGSLSLFNGWRELAPEFGDEPEMGWIFATGVHGQGLAGEACRAALDWADRMLQPTPIWAIIAPENAPSIALAERLGFAHHSETLYNNDPTLVLRRPPIG